MCTAIILVGISNESPFVLGFNRDEIYNRPFSPPRLWAFKKKKALAPVDGPTNTTWVGVNSSGLVISILNYLKVNRRGHKSRGNLLLTILENCSNVNEAEKILLQTKHFDYSPCTFLLADHKRVNITTLHEKIDSYQLSNGVFVISDTDVFEDHAPHVTWAKNYLENLTLNRDIITNVKISLSEHTSSSIVDLTTCCHSKLSGTTSSQIISLNNEGTLNRFLYCPTRPCTGRYEDYTYLIKGYFEIRKRQQ